LEEARRMVVAEADLSWWAGVAVPASSTREVADDMPESLLSSRSEFDRFKLRLGRWLREDVTSVRSLDRELLNDYYKAEQRIVAGWRIEVEHSGQSHSFDVLLNDSFPYSPIRIAYRSQDVYLKRPHVEPFGLLCLPRRPAPSAGIE